MKKLAECLKKKRGEFSIPEASRYYNFPERTWYRLENREHEPTLTTLNRVGKLLNKPVSELLDD